MRKLLLFIFLMQNLAFAGEAEQFQKDLDEINSVLTLSYPSDYYKPLNLTLEERRYLQLKDEIQTFYLELMNKYLHRYSRDPSIQPYSLTEKELSQIHYEILEKNFKAMNRHYAYNLDEVKYLEEIKRQSGLFSKNFITKTQSYLAVNSEKLDKVDLKALIEKLQFKFKHSMFSKTGTVIRSRMKGRVVALTFTIAFVISNVLTPTFLLLKLPKLAFAASMGIQPAFKQIIVSALYNIKVRRDKIDLMGKEGYKKFKKFRNYLFADKPLMKSIKILESDNFYKFRYSPRWNVRNALSYFTGKNYLNYSDIKKYFSEKSRAYSSLLSEAEALFQRDYDRTLFVIQELFKRRNEDEAIKFFKEFDYSFLKIKNQVKNLEAADQWIHSILAIKDLDTFQKALQNAPENIPTFVYFEVLKTKILPIFADFDGITYKDFRYLVKNLYKKELTLIKNGNNTLDRKELDALARQLAEEASRSQGCEALIKKGQPRFNFLRGIIF